MYEMQPTRELTICAENRHSNVGYTLYEGRTVLGWPEMSFQRSKPVLRQGEIVAEPGQGHFLPTLESPAEPIKLRHPHIVIFVSVIRVD